MRPRTLLRITLTLALLLGGFAACGKDEAPKKDKSAKSKKDKDDDDDGEEKVDPALVKKAEELEKSIKNGRLPREATDDKGNAPAVVYLAKSATEPETRAAGFYGMYSMFASNEKDEKRTMVDDAYRETVLEALDTKTEGKVLAAALKASMRLLGQKPPDDKTVAAVIDLYEKHEKPEGRLEALEVLRNAQAKGDDVKKTYLDAMKAKEAFIVSRALSDAPSSPKEGMMYWDRAMELLKHEDPGVRGRAAQLIGHLSARDPKKGEEAGKALVPLLEDENNFTKSAAADGLAWAKYMPAVHKIMPLLDNDEENRYDIRGFERLSGGQSRLHHDGSAWSVVRDAALYALKRMSSKTGERFDYKVSGKTKKADLDMAVADAKTWYGKVKGEIPTT
ncbi:MAG: HEAT repeat domain-containing protein [Myxococcota bacterium]